MFEGSEAHVRSFTFVDDIIDGVVSVIGKEAIVDGEVINLGTEQEHTTGEGIAIVEELLDTQIRKDIVPRRGGDQMFTKANIDKARRLLDYNPSTTLKEGLQKQIEWYKKEFVD